MQGVWRTRGGIISGAARSVPGWRSQAATSGGFPLHHPTRRWHRRQWQKVRDEARSGVEISARFGALASGFDWNSWRHAVRTVMRHAPPTVREDRTMEGKDTMLTPAASGPRLTYDDFVLIPFDGMRHEIIDGTHFVTASPNTRHQLLVGRLHFAIESALRARPGTGQVFLAPFDVELSRWDVVEPDLLFVAADQSGILTKANVQGAPALVVEILSSSTRNRDEQIKLRLFERSGVREYWLVDPDADTVRIYRRAPSGGFVAMPDASADGDAALTTPLMSNLRLTLTELFARD
jgi:Uma2 family endonuclease